jgi:hypothetical protein
MGFPPNITKPYRPPDSACSRDSSYKLLRTDHDDIGDNLIDDSEKGKAIRSNPSTFSLELSSGSGRISFSFSIFVVFHLMKWLLNRENQSVL